VAASSSVAAWTIVGLVTALGVFGRVLKVDTVHNNFEKWLYPMLPSSKA
jgi:hypothetical protein